MEATSSDHAKIFEPAGANRSDGVSQLATKAAATASSMIDRGQKTIGEAGDAVKETAQKVLSKASDGASDLADTGRSAANSVARQINEQPLVAMLLGAAAIGYFASLLIHRRR